MLGMGAGSVTPAADPMVLDGQVQLLQMEVGCTEPEILGRMAKLAAELTGSTFGHVVYVNADGRPAHTATRFPDDAPELAADLVLQAVLEGSPKILYPTTGEESAGGLLSVPVVHSGHAPFVLIMGGASSGYSQGMGDAVQILADCAWTVVLRGREVRGLRDRLDMISGRQSAMGLVTWEWNPATRETVWDPAASTVVPGLCTDCRSWEPLVDLLDDDSAQTLRDVLAEPSPFAVELSGNTPDGQNLRLLVQGHDGDEPGTQPGVMHGTVMDVSVLAALEDAHRRATHDPLTGLPNRAWLVHALEARITQPVHRREDQFAVFFIDLDDFKSVNDEFGHILGDEVLTSCAQRIQQVASKRERVARFGGDEFVLIQDGPLTWQSVEALAHRIRTAVGRPVRLGQHVTKVGASIGVALCSSDQWSATDLLRQADEALLDAKKSTWGVVIRDGRDAWHA